jgi:hypothetical protein
MSETVQFYGGRGKMLEIVASMSKSVPQARDTRFAPETSYFN